MKRHLMAFVLVLAAVTVPLFGGGKALAADRELIVSAAASLTNAMQEVGKKFEAANPGTKVVFNFGASGALLQQMTQGAPVDVFASADQKTMDQAAEKNLIVTESRKDFVANGLVLIVPADSKVKVKNLKDLSAKEIGKIALGSPDSVPAGRYAREVLGTAGQWDALQPKFIFGNNVRQVLDYVIRGEVEAGFVFSTDARIAGEKVTVAFEAEGHQPIRYPLAVVAGTQHKEDAARFVAYVLGPEAQAVFASFGFKKP